MALQVAVVAKTTSDAALIRARAIINSLAMDVINDKITVESERTDTENRIYKTDLNFGARIKNDVVEINQSDNSYVKLNDLLDSLYDKGYRTSHRLIGKKDRIRLTVAWD